MDITDFCTTSHWCVDDDAFDDPDFVLVKEVFGCPMDKNDWDPGATELVGEWSDDEIEEEKANFENLCVDTDDLFDDEA